VVRTWSRTSQCLRLRAGSIAGSALAHARSGSRVRVPDGRWGTRCRCLGDRAPRFDPPRQFLGSLAPREEATREILKGSSYDAGAGFLVGAASESGVLLMASAPADLASEVRSYRRINCSNSTPSSDSDQYSSLS